MAAVRSELAKVGYDIHVQSKPGTGTTAHFLMLLPLRMGPYDLV